LPLNDRVSLAELHLCDPFGAGYRRILFAKYLNLSAELLEHCHELRLFPWRLAEGSKCEGHPKEGKLGFHGSATSDFSLRALH
jgi:hypothetical protein